ncbi:unnamed protein product [Caretta caretta]
MSIITGKGAGVKFTTSIVGAVSMGAKDISARTIHAKIIGDRTVNTDVVVAKVLHAWDFPSVEVVNIVHANSDSILFVSCRIRQRKEGRVVKETLAIAGLSGLLWSYRFFSVQSDLHGLLK